MSETDRPDPNGAASDIATGFVRAVRHLAAPSRDGQAFAGTPAVGALFTASAAHCVTGTSGTIDFVPGYHGGDRPYGTWTVTKIYVDQAWKSSSSDDDRGLARQKKARVLRWYFPGRVKSRHCGVPVRATRLNDRCQHERNGASGSAQPALVRRPTAVSWPLPALLTTPYSRQSAPYDVEGPSARPGRPVNTGEPDRLLIIPATDPPVIASSC